MHKLKYSVTIISIGFILSGCNDVMLPTYNQNTKSLHLNNYKIDNVTSFDKKLNERVHKMTKGVINIHSYEVKFDNENCQYINYSHSYIDSKPNVNAQVTDTNIMNIQKEDTLTKIDNIDFVYKPNHKEYQYYIHTKNQHYEFVTIKTDRKCFETIKKYFETKSKQSNKTL